MLYIFLNIFAFIITVGILITIHELGHFTVARFYGVTIQRFSIGFGYTLWKYLDKKNTEYVISAIPLGGYVKMLNQNDISIIKNKSIQYQTFEDTKIWKRALIVAAGPIFNIVFAFFIYFFLFIIGISTYRPIIADIIPNSAIFQSNMPSNVEIRSINNIPTPDWEAVRLTLINTLNNKEKKIIFNVIPMHSSEIQKYFIDTTNLKNETNLEDPLTSLGIIPLSTYIIKPIISKIQKNSPAINAGLKIGDQILSINNQLINTWNFFIQEIKNRPNEKVKISINRENKIVTLEVYLKKITKNNKSEGFIGVSPTYSPIPTEYTIKYQFGPILSTQKSIEKIWKLTSLTWNTLFKLIIGDIKLNNLGGPISIAQGAKEAAKYGLISYLMFLSLISINLGIINLFPLPILDGGHLVLLIIEIFIGKKVSKKIEEYTYYFGLILLTLLMCIAIFNDLSRLYLSK